MGLDLFGGSGRCRSRSRGQGSLREAGGGVRIRRVADRHAGNQPGAAMRILIAVFGICAYAQPALERPGLGMIVDANGALRPVYGIAGSVTLGGPIAAGVLSTACSRKLCFSKTATSILWGDQETAAPPGPALFALDGNRAFVYFPQSNQLMRWHDGVLKPMDFDIGGEILSLRAAHGRVEFAVRRDGEFWIVRSDGAVLGALTGAGAPVMLLKDGALFKAGDALIVRRDDGTELSFDLTGVESLLPMGAGYVQIRAGAAAYALCVEPEREQLFVLPEPLP